MKYRVLFVCVLLIVSMGLAQVPDTVYVEPGLNTLVDAVEDSLNAGKVFKLQRGGLYVNERTMNPTDVILHIIGEAQPDEQKPAMIQLYANSPTWANMISVSAAKDVKFENIGFYIYNQIGIAFLDAFYVTSSDVNIVVDNCFFDGANWANMFLSTDATVLLKNNLFLNCINANFYQQGNLYEGAWGSGHCPTVKVYNNTMINTGGIGAGSAMNIDTVEFSHNTWCLVDRPVAPESGRIEMNRIFENNIMVDVGARGFVGPRPTWKEHPDSTDYFMGDNGTNNVSPTPWDSVWSVIEVDSLYRVTGDSTYLDGPDEGDRIVQINNNLKYTSQLLKDFQAEITATNIPLFNSWTQAILESSSNKSALNNYDETVDPDFVQGLPDEAYEKFIKNTKERRNLGLRSEEYPESENWNWGEIEDMGQPYTLPWPVPVDLKPQNRLLENAGTDGYPLGDLNWWPKEMLDSWEQGLENDVAELADTRSEKFALSQNYPNPFNPTTVISYEIAKPANVSLIVYNVVGQKVKTLVNNSKHVAGISEVTWDGTNNVGNKVVSGIYFYKLTVDNNVVLTKKMTMLK